MASVTEEIEAHQIEQGDVLLRRGFTEEVTRVNKRTMAGGRVISVTILTNGHRTHTFSHPSEKLLRIRRSR